MAYKPSPQVLLSQELNKLLELLEPDDKKRKWIEDMADILKENMLAGEKIRKRQIPRYYIERYEVNNLFRYSHPEGYRSCYTLLNIEGVGVCPIILDIMDHRAYERRFGYTGSSADADA